MSSHLEILIQEQLLSHNVEQVCENLIQHLESADVASPDEIKTIAQFLLRSGSADKFIKLITFLFREKIEHIPWSAILEFAQNYKSQWPSGFLKYVKEGALECRQEFELARTSQIAQDIPEVFDWVEQRNHSLIQKMDQEKAKLLDQLEYFKSQRLFDQEKKNLMRLYKMYPNEPSIKHLYQENQLRYAEDFLNRRNKSANKNLSQLQKEYLKKEVDAKFSESLLKQSQNNPDLIYDLAISALIHEEYETGLKILEPAESTSEIEWLRIELLLAAQRHLEVLQILPNLETQFAADAETFFATAYYRAQALWGLKQSHLAIEVLEALLESRPNYRSAQLLLSKWTSGS